MKTTIKNIVIGAIGLFWLVPVYLIVINSAKSAGDYNTRSQWAWPEGFQFWDNLVEAVKGAHIDQGLLSSAIYATVGPTLGVLIGAGVAYAIVALRMRHGFGWFCLIFGGTVIPVQMLLMPLFMGYAITGLYDTHIGMILVYAAMSVPFCAFIMRNFFTQISYNVFEAGELDGASSWKIFWRIFLPMSATALVAVFILQAVSTWNELLLGLTLSQSHSVRTIMPALYGLSGAYGGSTMPVVLAGGLLVSLPTVVLFLCTQRFFSTGLSLGHA